MCGRERFWHPFANAAVGVLVLALALAAPALAQQPPEPAPAAAEQLFALANSDRAAHGVPPLTASEALASAARFHADQIAARGVLEHQFPGEPDLAARAARAGTHFRAVAENIAIGGSAAQIEDEWMHSAGHRANLLDPRMNAIGIALVRRGDRLYAVEDFAATVASLSPQQVESRVEAMLQQAGVRSVTATREARQTCAMAHGWIGPQPLFVMRWEGADLSRLPDALTSKLASRRYQSAAVGACGSAHPQQAFTSYHVAVLLY